MNKSFVIALALILALIKGSNGWFRQDTNGRDEVKCSSRRCCSMRDELHEYDLPEGLDCSVLTDRECGQYDSYCEWDCDEANPIRKNKNINRRYRGISSGAGSFPRVAMNGIPAKNDKEYSNKDLLQKCLADGGKFISHDDCGVEYEEEIKDWDSICHRLYNNDKDHHNDHEYNTHNNNQDGYDKKRRLQNGVLGPDGRTRVTNMDIYPYNAVLFMEFNKADGRSFRCTATMISDNVALTAGHCVWDPTGYHTDIRMYYNMDDCNELDRQFNAGNYYTGVLSSILIPSAYRNNYIEGGDNADNDIALLRLNTNGARPDYMAFGYDNSFQAGTAFTSIGYPGDKECYPMEQTCAYDEFKPAQQTSTTCDSVGGQSGSGKYRWIENDPVIFGVISEGVNGVDNTDCRINADKYNWICAYTQNCN